MCIAALKLRRQQQDTDRDRAGDAWHTGPGNHGAWCRETCGSLLGALDVHPRVAMQILRHSKIAVTMEIYTEIPSASTRDALRKLGHWLGE